MTSVDAQNPTRLLPARKSRERLDDVLVQARRNLEHIDSFESSARALALEDWGMRTGRAHWSAVDLQKRRREGRPALTINRLPAMIRGVLSDQMRARLTVKFSAVGAVTSERVRNLDDTQSYDLASVYEGLARDIDRTSRGKLARDWGFNCALTGGTGYWRVTTEITPYTANEVDIYVRRILNPFSVYLDPQAVLRGPEWAQFGFIGQWYDKADFRARYPGARDWDGTYARGEFGAHWWRDNQIRVSEYLRKVREKRTLITLSDGRTVDEDAYWRVSDLLQAQGVEPVGGAVDQDVPVVYWYLLSGAEVLEGPIEIPTQYIPIVPCYGDVTIDDSAIHTESLIRHSHDAQRSINVFESALTEKAMLSPKSPFVADKEQVGPYQEMWQNANRVNYGVLIYKHKDGVAPPRREQGAILEPGLVERADAAHRNLEHTIGRYKDDMGAESNAMSGRQTELRQSEGDSSVGVFFENYRAAVEYEGRILADMIPRVYDGTRVKRIQLKDGAEDYIRINMPVPMFERGAVKMVKLNDLSRGQFDVAVEAAPSAATQRKEAADVVQSLITAVAQADPQAVRLLMPTLLRNLEIQGGDDLARMFDALVPPEAKAAAEDDDEQQQGMSQAQVQLLVQQAVQEALTKAGMMVEQTKADAEAVAADAKMQQAQNDQASLMIEQMKAIADRIEAQAALLTARTEAGVAAREAMEPPEMESEEE